tara:strand:+ start:1345 stop:4527 length:3183 start_codon:yes stop_codon:yes gene_type:complete
MTNEVSYTKQELEDAVLELDNLYENAADPYEKELYLKDLDVMTEALQVEYDRVTDYADVVTEEVRQEEQERMSAVPQWALPASMGAMPLPQAGQAAIDFTRFMGFGEFGQKKSVEGVGDVTRTEELALQWDRGSNMTGRALLTMEAVGPSTGQHRNPETGLLEQVSAEVKYDRLLEGQGITGEEFLKMSIEEREDVLLANKEFVARETHSTVADVLDIAGEDESIKRLAFTLAELSDPALIGAVALSGGSLIPNIAVGGAYTVSNELSRQLHEDEINAERLVVSGLMGTGFSAAFMPIQSAGLAYKTAVKLPLKGVEKVTKGTFHRIQNLKAKRGSVDTATAIAEKLKNRTAWHLFNTKHLNGKGVTNKQAVRLAEADLALTPKNRMDVLAYAKKGSKGYLTRAEAAKRIELMDNPVASTTRIGKAWDVIGAPMVQAVKHIDQRLAGSLRNHDMRTQISLSNTLNKAEPIFKRMRQAKKNKSPVAKKAYEDMEFALLNQQWVKASRLQNKHFPELEGQLPKLHAIFDDIHKRANAVGIKMAYLNSYVPRYIKDMPALRAALGRKDVAVIDRVLENEAKKANVGHWSQVEEEVLSDAITKVLTKGSSGAGRPKKLESGRTIRQIPERLRPYYHDVATSTQLYINRAEREIAKHEFFGASKKFKDNGRIDLDQSINATIGRQVLDSKKAGKELTTEQQDDLLLLMTARFEATEKTMSKSFATARDLQYAVLLGQFDAALIQLGDIGSSLYVNGVANTAKAMVTRNKNAPLTRKDLGLVSMVSAEMSNLSGMVKFLDKTLTYSGFKAIDGLGKDVMIKAAWLKNTKLARTNPAAIEKKYGKVYEHEIGDMIADLRAGRVTDNTKLLMWNELADVQPIALSEMPRKYLEMDNGRILYSLKSFGLKQIALVRQNIIQKAQKGQMAEAMEEALRYALLVGVAGGTVENARTLLRTGDTSALMAVDDATMENLMKIIFMSKYSREKYLKEGKYGSWAVQSMLPAVPSIVDKGGAFIDSVLFEQEADPKAFNQVMRLVPVAGSAYYHMVGGGAENVIKRAEAERKDKE